jgi:uncharacterized BrkB/YihY/UPF0761 family membrane protein
VLGGANLYFEIVGDVGAVYGAIGALIALSFCVYLGAIAAVYGAHVAAVASTMPSRKEMDRELENAGESRPLGRFIGDALKGLVVRRR